MNNFKCAVLAAAMFATAPVWAAEATVQPATISGIEGTALVNQGEEFTTANDAQLLQPGDQVMVMEGGAATINFADGCVLTVESGSVVIVPEVSTCAGGVVNPQRVGASYAQAVGDDGTSNLVQGLVIGGTLLAIGTIVATDDDEPSSP